MLSSLAILRDEAELELGTKRQARSQGWARTGIARTGVISARPSVNRFILIETLFSCG